MQAGEVCRQVRYTGRRGTVLSLLSAPCAPEIALGVRLLGLKKKKKKKKKMLKKKKKWKKKKW